MPTCDLSEIMSRRLSGQSESNSAALWCRRVVETRLYPSVLFTFSPQDAQIISWLQEFRLCVTQLGKEHEQLIYVVLVRSVTTPGRRELNMKTCPVFHPTP